MVIPVLKYMAAGITFSNKGSHIFLMYMMLGFIYISFVIGAVTFFKKTCFLLIFCTFVFKTC